MNGKDLVIYILENDLLDQPVFEDGSLLGFLTVTEAAIKFDVGLATIRVWVHEGMLPAIKIGDMIYIPANAKNPKEALNVR